MFVEKKHWSTKWIYLWNIFDKIFHYIWIKSILKMKVYRQCWTNPMMMQFEHFVNLFSPWWTSFVLDLCFIENPNEQWSTMVSLFIELIFFRSTEAKMLMVQEEFFDRNLITDHIFDMWTEIDRLETFQPIDIQSIIRTWCRDLHYRWILEDLLDHKESNWYKWKPTKNLQQGLLFSFHLIGENKEIPVFICSVEICSQNLKSEWLEWMNQRKIHSPDYRTKLKRQEHFLSKINLKISMSDVILHSNDFSFLLWFSIDQRVTWTVQYQHVIGEEFVSIRNHFNLTEILLH